MGDNQTVPVPGKAERAKLVITMYEDQSIKVDGPIGERVLCYGMLECAKDALFEYAADCKRKKSNGHGIINFVRKLK